jgi:NTE family protein
MINATCYETGKNWRFERFRMGDYSFGYTNDTNIPLSDALAASAGFPGLIGPLVLQARPHSWYRYATRSTSETPPDDAEPAKRPKTEPVAPPFSRVHLWDGGVYDNHGLEALHDFNTGWLQGIDFLVVSDGSGKPKPEKYRLGAQVFLRIITGVMMDQIRSLRARAVIERIKNHDDLGVYLSIGNSCLQVIEGAGRRDELSPVCQECLSDEEAGRAGNFPTVIRRLSAAEFELLFRHGFEIADYTLVAYYPDRFKHVTYRTSLSGAGGDEDTA